MKGDPQSETSNDQQLLAYKGQMPVKGWGKGVCVCVCVYVCVRE